MNQSRGKKITNRASQNKIQEEFLPLVSDVKSKVLNDVNDVKSLILRGSVSTGDATLFTSDIDFVLVTVNRISEKDKKHITNVSKTLERKYPIVTDVDITTLSYEELRKQEIPNKLIFKLKTNSCILYGDDIRKSLPEFYLNEQLVDFLYGDFDEEIKDLYEIFERDEEREYNGRIRPIRFWCRWTMRKIVRSTNALTMLEVNEHSSDLITCYENIKKVRPEIVKDIQRAIQWDLNPVNDSETVLTFLDDFLPRYLRILREKDVIQ